MLGSRLMMGYGLLVGAPLVILFTVMEVGQGLTAPPAVSGEWVVSPGDGSAGGCLGAWTAGPNATLSIAQSGAEVTVTLNNPEKTSFSGSIESGRLVAISDGTRKLPGCGMAARILMDVTVSGAAGQRAMRGELRLNRCVSCPAAPFAAVRNPLSKRRGQ